MLQTLVTAALTGKQMPAIPAGQTLHYETACSNRETLKTHPGALCRLDKRANHAARRGVQSSRIKSSISAYISRFGLDGGVPAAMV